MKHNIFDVIRDQSSLKKAEAIRSGSGISLRDRCVTASKKHMEGFGEAQLDSFVDVLLMKAAGYAIDECVELVPELAGGGKEARAAKQAMVESVIMSGQYFKATIKTSLKGIIDNLHVRVAETVASIATEATIFTLTNPKLLGSKKEE